MYLGSVRFYKHLIYITLTLILSSALLGLYTVGTILCTRPTGRIAGAVELETATSSPAIEEPKDHWLPEDTGPTEEIYPVSVAKPDYQLSHPELYSQPPEQFFRATKTAYLTFDDGPSSRTLEILDILREHDIKATFFVVTDNSDPDILKQIVEDGHALGIHTHSHDYGEIYRSVEAYLDDFQASLDTIYRATSIKPGIFRFPGGSINSYNQGLYQELIAEMLRRGFVYYDWNVSTQDSVPNISVTDIVQSVTSHLDGKDNLFILAHDSRHKKNTVKALPKIIALLKEKGYEFDKIDKTVEPVVFAYPHY